LCQKYKTYKLYIFDHKYLELVGLGIRYLGTSANVGFKLYAPGPGEHPL